VTVLSEILCQDEWNCGEGNRRVVFKIAGSLEENKSFSKISFCEADFGVGGLTTLNVEKTAESGIEELLLSNIEGNSGFAILKKIKRL